MHKIVILDDVTLTSAQQEVLRAAGTLDICRTIPADDEETLRRLNGADICIAGWTTLSEKVLRYLPSLRMICLWATGTNCVDLNAARDLGIVVTNVPAYSATAVAELCIGYMVALSRSLLAADRHVRQGEYAWQEFKGSQLEGKVLGIIGLGSIGMRLSRMARCMGMQVIARTQYPSLNRAREAGVEFKGSLEALMEESDFLSLNCALTPQTQNLIDDAALSHLRPSAFLINTARAGLINQPALVTHLKSRTILGAALDDIDTVDPSATELFQLDNVILSPHIGFHTTEALIVVSDICVKNVLAFLRGDPINVV